MAETTHPARLRIEVCCEGGCTVRLTVERPRRTRHLVFAALAATLLLAALGTTQCRFVEDRVTGVDIASATASSRQACIRACDAQAKAARRAEDSRYRTAKKAC